MHISSKRGFTLMEIILVIAVIGILVSALVPNITAYQKRGRDTTRLTHINSLAKVINNYFIDKEHYPNHVSGCVDSTALSKYGPIQIDPLTSNDNGCGTATRSYAYGSSALLISSPDEFTVIANMENIFGGNFDTGSVAGLTGVLNQNAFTTLRSGIKRGSGEYYIMVK